MRGSHLMEESFEGVKRGRIINKQDLTIEGHNDIFVIGDCSAFIPATRASITNNSSNCYATRRAYR